VEDVCSRQSWDSAGHEWTCDEGAEKPAESIKCCGAPVDFQLCVGSYGAGCRAFYTDINSCYSWASEPEAAALRTATEEITAAADVSLPAANESLNVTEPEQAASDESVLAGAGAAGKRRAGRSFATI